MKALYALVLAVVLGATGLLVASPASAGKSCGNCAPTTVVVNGDGTITASTTAVPQDNCGGQAYPNKGQCNLRVLGTEGLQSTFVLGSPATVNVTVACPCTAQFWVHSGQWQPYSAASEPFTL